MEFIKILRALDYTLYNVNAKKVPVCGNIPIRDWNKMSHEDLIKKLDLGIEKIGIRLGEQGNGKNILSLDFDLCNKVNGEYVDCEETKQLLDYYYKCNNNNEEGMYTSSTINNKNVLVDYTNTTELKDKILNCKKVKIVKKDCGFELLLGGNQVIPPTMTKCKKSNQFLYPRKFLTDKPIKIINDDDPTCKFILEWFDKCEVIKTEKKTTPKKVKPNVMIENKLHDDIDYAILDLIDIQYWNDFESWKRLVWAMKIENYSIDTAREYSQKSDNFDDDGFVNVWDNAPTEITISQGTINYYAKLSNENKYYSIARSKKISQDVVLDINKFYDIKSDIKMPEDLLKGLEQYDSWNDSKREELDKQMKEYKTLVFYDEIKKKSLYFEDFHFKVMNPPCFGRLSYNKTLLINSSEFELQYENVFIDSVDDKPVKWSSIWRKQKYLKTYENVDFLPQPLPCPNHTMNTFNGLRAEKLQNCDDVDIELFKNHIDILSGNDKKGSEYIINYLAHAVQKPGELPRVALVFQSEQGTGKNIFFENFVRKLLGAEYLLQTAEMDKVIGRFSMINNKLFVIMDETSGKDSFTNSDKIKNIITAEQIAWERKGIDGININNCGRYLFFSNNDTPVKIESSDRRYVVYKCSTERQNDRDYFKAMSNLFNDDDAIKTFYNYLMSIDIEEWDSINDRPITQAYKDIQSANVPSMAKWLEERYYTYNHYRGMGNNDDVIEEYSCVKSSELFKNYKEWLCTNGFKSMEYNSTKFGREITKYNVGKKRKPTGNYYVFEYNKIKEFLISKKYMEE